MCSAGHALARGISHPLTKLNRKLVIGHRREERGRRPARQHLHLPTRLPLGLSRGRSLARFAALPKAPGDEGVVHQRLPEYSGGRGEVSSDDSFLVASDFDWGDVAVTREEKRFGGVRGVVNRHEAVPVFERG